MKRQEGCRDLMSYDQMIEFLRHHDVDLDTFDARGAKSLKQLHEELQSEARLAYDEAMKRVCRTSNSVRITVTAEGRRYSLRETERVYPNGHRVPKGSDWTVSETRKWHETPNEAAIRCLKEECGLRVPPQRLEIPHWSKSTPGGFEMHPSSVYPDLWTYTVVDWIEVHLKRPWKRMARTIDDCGVKITLVWVDRSSRA